MMPQIEIGGLQGAPLWNEWLTSLSSHYAGTSTWDETPTYRMSPQWYQSLSEFGRKLSSKQRCPRASLALTLASTVGIWGDGFEMLRRTEHKEVTRGQKSSDLLRDFYGSQTDKPDWRCSIRVATFSAKTRDYSGDKSHFINKICGMKWWGAAVSLAAPAGVSFLRVAAPLIHVGVEPWNLEQQLSSLHTQMPTSNNRNRNPKPRKTEAMIEIINSCKQTEYNLELCFWLSAFIRIRLKTVVFLRFNRAPNRTTSTDRFEKKRSRFCSSRLL